MTVPARDDVRFSSGSESCAAWLYRRPEWAGSGKTPAIVIGHGLGGVKEFRLAQYAEAFQNAGYTALVFDYTHWNDSTGQPRQLLSIPAQLNDWAAALTYVRSLDIVDPARVAVWGTSFGGGHVLEMAVRDPSIACALSQCPFTSGPASVSAPRDRGSIFRTPIIAGRAVLDQLLGLFSSYSIQVPIIGKPGEIALMTQPDVVVGFEKIIDTDRIVNSVSARLALSLPRYVPGRTAAKATIPIFVAICGKDSVAPAGATLEFAKKIPKGEWTVYDELGHFDIYHGEGLQRALADYLAFLDKHLPIKSG